ncbi:MAG: dihydropteroate synthase [Gammaproteobacteria bacterium]|nr:dihydropteroate synthase [Gammaproteobacteria bacterium]
MQLALADRLVDLSAPLVMGIVNVTPDSFSDGGQHATTARAIDHALQLVAEGAAMVDIGGESTRPGAQAVSEAEELARVVPVIAGIRARSDVIISVDTSKPAVMAAAVAAGAQLINDVWALRQPGALAVAAASGVAVCLMHMQGEPRTMQQAPEYADVVAEVATFLQQRVEACETAGIGRNRIVLDPGFGFGKNLSHNFRLLARLNELAGELPLLAGMSRKSMIGAVTGRDLQGRLAGSVAAAVLAAVQGARIIRVHDVAATVDALAVTMAMLKEKQA